MLEYTYRMILSFQDILLYSQKKVFRLPVGFTRILSTISLDLNFIKYSLPCHVIEIGYIEQSLFEKSSSLQTRIMLWIWGLKGKNYAVKNLILKVGINIFLPRVSIIYNFRKNCGRKLESRHKTFFLPFKFVLW